MFLCVSIFKAPGNINSFWFKVWLSLQLIFSLEVPRCSVHCILHILGFEYRLHHCYNDESEITVIHNTQQLSSLLIIFITKVSRSFNVLPNIFKCSFAIFHSPEDIWVILSIVGYKITHRSNFCNCSIQISPNLATLTVFSFWLVHLFYVLSFDSFSWGFCNISPETAINTGLSVISWASSA